MRGGSWQAWRIAALVTVGCGAIPGVAQAVPGDLVVDARPGREGDGTALGVNASGKAALAWVTAKDRKGRVRLQATTRSPGRAFARPTTLASVRSAPAIVGALVDDVGTSRIVWAESPRFRDDATLRTSSRTAGGRWTTPQTLGRVKVDGLLSTRVLADVRADPGGGATVAWCQGGNFENVLSTKDPATLFTRELRASGAWSAASARWHGRVCDGPTLTGERRGEGSAVWLTWLAEVGEISGGPQLSLERATTGAWSTAPRRVPLADAEGVDYWPSVLPQGGTLRLLGSNRPYGDDSGQPAPGRRGVSATLAPGATGIDPVAVPNPSSEQTKQRWLGGGPLASWTAAVDAADTPVVVAGFEATPADHGGQGLGTVWAATQAPDGAWSWRPVDDLAATSNAVPTSDWPAPVLGADRAGRLVATWAAPVSEAPCRVGTFQSTRAADGTWSRRILVGEHATGTRDGCDDGPAPHAEPAAGLVWSATSRRLEVEAVPTKPRAVRAPHVRLITRTWGQVRRAGAIEFSCRTRSVGYCHVSLVDGALTEAIRERLELYCRPAIGSTRVERPRRAVRIRLELAPKCFSGGARPRAGGSALRVPVLVAADAVGRRSGAATTSVVIR